MTYGVNNARRIPCLWSPHHGFHPYGEKCGYCEPPKPLAQTLEHLPAETVCVGDLYGGACCGSCMFP